ncbi:hypothetical protein niasHT_014100 [Heterodera trifolii]|uniref:Uncharacterized protein n=1 Tax=Heterodera trifolii TaxID=157864 RepID=A0ABD2LGD2_9BILA
MDTGGERSPKHLPSNGDDNDQQQQQQTMPEVVELAQFPVVVGSSPSVAPDNLVEGQNDQQQQDNNNEHLDRALEVFACSYNLTAQNVKNIIFHIVKNPQTFATLVRKDPDAMAGLRMTRARLRQLERISRRRIPTARLRPIVGPKTFLDINYGDDEVEEGTSAKLPGQQDDEEDMDYSPANDPTAPTERRRRRRRRKTKTDGERGQTQTNSDRSASDCDDAEDASSSMCSSDTDFVCSDMDEQKQQLEQGTLEAATVETEQVGDEQHQKQQQHQRDKHDEEEEEETEEGQSVEYLTKVDNPIYPIFIKSLATDTEIDPEVRQQLYDDEDNDPEYVFPDFEDLCDEQEDEYEFRRDRATEIPRWEVKALEQDFVEDGDEPSPLEVPVEPICAGDATSLTTTNGRQSAIGIAMVGAARDKESTVKIFWSSNFAKPPSQRLYNPPSQQRHSTDAATMVNQRSNRNDTSSLTFDGDGGGTSTSPQTTEESKDEETRQNRDKHAEHHPTPSSSSSLLNPSPTITPVELDALKVQLEKHVQLLCQAIVGTSQYADLVEPHNKSMLMLSELDGLSRERGAHSAFNVPTLEAAIYSAHDIKACREVNLALASAAAAETNGDEIQPKNTVELLQLKDEHRPSNETMWVLSRSGAVRYPELLCPYRFSSAEDCDKLQSSKMGPTQRFLHSEQLLLAIGLYQLCGVQSHRNGKMRNRYQHIQQYFLPTKRVDQIRNHIKNVHSSPSPTIYHQLIMQAEKGHFPVTYRPDLGEKAQRKAPIEWPANVQPYWLKWLSNLLGKCQTQMIMVDDGDITDNDAGQQLHGVSEALNGTDPPFSPPAPPAVSAFADHLHQPASSDTSNSEAKTAENAKIETATRQRHVKAGKKPRILATARKRCIPTTTGAASSTTSAMEQRKDDQHQLDTTTTVPYNNNEAATELLGDVVISEEQQQPDFVDVEEVEEHVVGVETRWRKRIRTASSTTTEDGASRLSGAAAATDVAEKGGTTPTHTMVNNISSSRTCSSAANGAGGAEAATSSTMAPMTAKNAGVEKINGTNCAESGAMPAAATTSQLQKKSRRHERAERGMAALGDAHALEQTERALAAAIYEDFGKRMFMHQDKLRAVQRVLATAPLPRHDPSTSSSPSAACSTAQCFASLWQLMGLTHPQLFHLFAAIAPEAQLPHALRADPHWQACKRALRMLKTIHTYLAVSRTPAQMKHMLKFLKEISVDITSEQQFFEALQRQFGVRDEPLWRLLRREWMGGKFVENVEDWEYEFVDMDKQQQHTSECPTVSTDGIGNGDKQQFQFEHVRLPYRRDPSERSRLRVRHGRVTAELNGRLCNVAIAYAPSSLDTSSSDSLSVDPTTSEGANVHKQQRQSKEPQRNQNRCCWTRKMDMELMLAYKNAGGDPKKCVNAFLHQRSTQPKIGESVAAEDAEKRLDQLLNVANTLRKGRRETEERDGK